VSRQTPAAETPPPSGPLPPLQSWEKVLVGEANEQLISVIASAENCYYAVGTVESIGGRKQGWLLAFDLTGDVSWAHSKRAWTKYEYWGGIGIPNGIVAYGSSISLKGLGAPQGSAARYNFDGKEEEIPLSGFGIVTSGAVSKDGSSFFAGLTKGRAVASLDTVVTKMSPVGAVLWQQRIGGKSSDIIRSLKSTRDGGVVGVGATQSGGSGGYDAWVVKLGPDGGIEWQRMLGGSENDGFYDVEQDSDGGYVMVGVNGSRSFEDSDLWMVKLDKSGKEVWDEVHGKPGFDFGASLTPAHGGGWIVVGSVKSRDTGQFDARVLSIDSKGDDRWQRTYGGVDNDELRSVKATRDGGYIAVGYTVRSTENGKDGWILKLDGEGRIVDSVSRR
jgi:hypothetical protein